MNLIFRKVYAVKRHIWLLHRIARKNYHPQRRWCRGMYFDRRKSCLNEPKAHVGVPKCLTPDSHSASNRTTVKEIAPELARYYRLDLDLPPEFHLPIFHRTISMCFRYSFANAHQYQMWQWLVDWCRFVDKCFLSNDIMDYNIVAQGKTVIPGVDDGEEATLTDVSPDLRLLAHLILSSSFISSAPTRLLLRLRLNGIQWRMCMSDTAWCSQKCWC